MRVVEGCEVALIPFAAAAASEFIGLHLQSPGFRRRCEIWVQILVDLKPYTAGAIAVICIRDPIE